MPEPDKTIDLDRRLSVLEERMNTISESYDRGWKLLEAKMGEDNAKLEAKMGEATAGMREDNARRDTEFAKLREDSALFREEMAKRDTEMAKRDTEMAKRDTANTRWLIGVIIAASAIVIAVLLAAS
ncbi:MAG: hypothetical protein OXD45_15790 [Rhodobacteraceae bacterium]|nr:hypothetical protein [Paracoccaceae bacterium]